jgi:hypothetical protein
LKPSPVALFAFNRPALTKRVFQAIRRAKPARLLLVADGPRPQVTGEAQRCQEVRSLLKVDWACKVSRDFSARNLGCRGRLSSGLDWVFRQVPEAMVLEDDCLPQPAFFRFCTEALARYRGEARVMMVNGSNFDDPAPGPRRYRFTRYGHVWGWASWRRAWRHYNVDASAWPAFFHDQALRRLFPGQASARRYWEDRFEAVWRGQVDTWDYQWLLAIWRQGGLCVHPGVNLVANIGFGGDATHTGAANPAMLQPVRALRFPLQGPPRLEADAAADAAVEARLFSGVERKTLRSWARFLRRRLAPPALGTL